MQQQTRLLANKALHLTAIPLALLSGR